MRAVILFIDNYDSFTYNLVQLVGSLGWRPVVVRNDATTAEELKALSPEAVIISPGPGRPADAGISCDAIRLFLGVCPILGVCLGHQCLASTFGGRIVRATHPMHGRISPISHEGAGVFEGIRSPCPVARYHSLMIDESTLPARLRVTARAEDQTIMAVEDRSTLTFGIQFHPESFLTPDGPIMLSNFLRLTGLS